jgi:hypothetical protein
MTFVDLGKGITGVYGICMVFRWHIAHLESVYVS